MQTISVAQIDGCHSRPFPPFLANVVVGDLVAPEVAHGRVAVGAETNINKEVGEGVAGAEGRVGGCAPGIDGRSKIRWCVPTAQFARLGRFKVETCAEGDDASDLC